MHGYMTSVLDHFFPLFLRYVFLLSLITRRENEGLHMWSSREGDNSFHGDILSFLFPRDIIFLPSHSWLLSIYPILACPFRDVDHGSYFSLTTTTLFLAFVINLSSNVELLTSFPCRMINDPKSAHFISWTELGTSFVVSNVGEFSRTILGSHFKHNNFSSFVRQLNMYGFHKINRTPRAQRTSTDAQTWEFSHHKFLRARPDLLDEIKRKALEPDPALKHRVELPGEVAAQLGAMRDENRRMWEQLSTERRRTEKLVGVVNRLWDVVGKAFPGSVPPFPAELLENESPDIYITSPTAQTSRYPPPLSMNTSSQPLTSYHSISPNSSPTAADFPQHISQHHQQQQHPHHQHPHTLSRQHSFQHVSFSRGEGSSSSPLPPSPGSMTMDLFDDSPTGRGTNKRQRLSNDDGIGMNGSSSADSLSLMSSVSSPGSGPTGPGIAGLTVPGKKSSRARSDSAPLGYGFNGIGTWQPGVGNIAGRPRSGSGLSPRNIHVPNIGTMSRNPPLLSISTVPSDPSNR
ncbi:HSF-type DNA-binding-domain-containing protein [Cyathus striatus]|nr:HSF-type DNA-binding-domain-containing protein [Cyathus striatus]